VSPSNLHSSSKRKETKLLLFQREKKEEASTSKNEKEKSCNSVSHMHDKEKASPNDVVVHGNKLAVQSVGAVASRIMHKEKE
jgi:hypothetical protein